MRDKLLLLILCIVSAVVVAVYVLRDKDRDAELDKARQSFELIQQENSKRLGEMTRELEQVSIERDDLRQKNTLLASRVRARESMIQDQKSRLEDRLRSVGSLPPPELASRWSELTLIPPDQFQATVGQNGQAITLTEQAARQTLIHLEKLASCEIQVELLEANTHDLSQQVDNKDKEIGGWARQLGLCDEKVLLINRERQAERDLLRFELSVEKAKAKKSKVKWFLWGLVGGAVAATVAR